VLTASSVRAELSATHFDSNELLSAQSDPNKYFRVLEQALSPCTIGKHCPYHELNEVAQENLVKAPEGNWNWFRGSSTSSTQTSNR